MAKVANRWLVWVGSPKLDAAGVPVRNDFGDLITERVEVAMESVVPDVVPTEVQQEWEAQGYINEDPSKERIAAPTGPPRVMLPPVLTQKMEHMMKKGSLRGGIPPRPIHRD